MLVCNFEVVLTISLVVKTHCPPNMRTMQLLLAHHQGQGHCKKKSMAFSGVGGVIYPARSVQGRPLSKPISHSEALKQVTYGVTDDKTLVISTSITSRHSLG